MNLEIAVGSERSAQPGSIAGPAPGAAGREPAAAPLTGAGFSATQWSVVLGSRPSSEGRTEALERLCRTYWLPIYGYLRRRGHDPADAQDLTQGFFAHVIGSDFLERPDPAKGRFRGYLIGALKHYLSNHFERSAAQKRGGGVQFIDFHGLDAEREFQAVDEPQRDPSEAYETGWAMALFARALRRLGEEQAAAGRSRVFEVLGPYLSAPPTRGDYDRAALELGLSRTHVAVAVHRLTSRYAELVKLEVAATLRDPADLRQEMLHLLQALRHR